MLQQAKNIAVNYKWWIIGGFLLLLGLVLYFYFAGRAAGKRAGAINLSNPINDTGTGNNPSQGAFLSEADVRQAAGKIHDDMSGVNVWGHNNELYETLLTYSDTDFIRVNNEFNTDYQKDSGQSFRQWMESEVTWIQIGTKWTVLKDSILQRMDKLKII